MKRLVALSDLLLVKRTNGEAAWFVCNPPFKLIEELLRTQRELWFPLDPYPAADCCK